MASSTNSRGIKCVLLYKLPRGAAPTKADAERIISALQERLGCVQADTRGGSAGSASSDGKQLEAVISVLRQAQAPDLSLLSSPSSLKEVWLFRLHREAPSKAFLLLKGGSEPRVTEADPGIRPFLERRLEYRQRTTAWVSSYSWHMGDKHSDVTVKLLQVTQGQAAPKALAVEVTYHPAVSMAAGGPLLEELAGRIAASLGPPPLGAPAGTLVLLQPNWKQQELPPTFGPMHVVMAYNELLAEGLGAR